MTILINLKNKKYKNLCAGNIQREIFLLISSSDFSLFLKSSRISLYISSNYRIFSLVKNPHGNFRPPKIVPLEKNVHLRLEFYNGNAIETSVSALLPHKMEHG